MLLVYPPLFMSLLGLLALTIERTAAISVMVLDFRHYLVEIL